MEEAGSEPGKPIHLLDRVMPGVGAPHKIEVMLGAMNPVDHEVHREQRQQDFPKAWQSLQSQQWAGQKSRRGLGGQAAKHVIANSINQQGEREREEVQLQIPQTVHWTSGPEPL